MFAVAVTFQVKLDCLTAFLPLMLENARTSLREEPGCQHFDICHTPGEATVFLYEIYDNKAAFDAHRAMDHFKDFDAATAQMIDTKKLRMFEEVIR